MFLEEALQARKWSHDCLVVTFSQKMEQNAEEKCYFVWTHVINDNDHYWYTKRIKKVLRSKHTKEDMVVMMVGLLGNVQRRKKTFLFLLTSFPGIISRSMIELKRKKLDRCIMHCTPTCMVHALHALHFLWDKKQKKKSCSVFSSYFFLFLEQIPPRERKNAFTYPFTQSLWLNFLSLRKKCIQNAGNKSEWRKTRTFPIHSLCTRVVYKKHFFCFKEILQHYSNNNNKKWWMRCIHNA